MFRTILTIRRVWLSAMILGMWAAASVAAAGELKDPLYYFDAEDGAGFKSALIMDAAGNLYGTTSGGGEYGQGRVFQLVPPGSSEAAWTRKVLLVFDGANGANNP